MRRSPVTPFVVEGLDADVIDDQGDAPSIGVRLVTVSSLTSWACASFRRQRGERLRAGSRRRARAAGRGQGGCAVHGRCRR